MSMGCPCKSASDMDSNCAYCPKGSKAVSYLNHDENYVDSGNYQNYNQYAPQDGGIYPNYNQYAAQDPYAPPSDYHMGGYKNQGQYGPNYMDDNQGARGNETNYSLLKAVAVFCTGCFLTMQLTTVANELG